MDMSAAFNLVDKTILVPKIKMLSCSDNFCKLIMSYMSGRTNSLKFSTCLILAKSGGASLCSVC